MTMFTRNDKTPESTAPTARASVLPPVGDKPEAPAAAPAVPEPRRASETAPAATHVLPAALQSVSVISRALKITGQLESTENIQIDGEIDGDVRGVNVKVGHNAKIKGSVYAEEVELSGTVDGKIEAKKVILTSSAHMSGDVIHQDITIQSGAYIAGHCRPEYGKPEHKQTPAARNKEAAQ